MALLDEDVLVPPPASRIPVPRRRSGVASGSAGGGGDFARRRRGRRDRRRLRDQHLARTWTRACSNPSRRRPSRRQTRGTRPAAAPRSAPGGSTRAHALRASSPPGPAPSSALVAELAFDLGQLGVALLQQRGAAHQHVVTKVVADRHLISQPAEIPVQLRDLRCGQLLAAASRGWAYIALAECSSGGDDVGQVLGLLLVALPAARAQVFQDGRRRRFAAGSRPRPIPWLCVWLPPHRPSGCRPWRPSLLPAWSASWSCSRRRVAGATDGDHLRRGVARRGRAARASDQHADAHRQQQHADARDQGQRVATLPCRADGARRVARRWLHGGTSDRGEA